MDSSTAQHHHQEMGLQTLESMLGCNKAQQEKKPRPDDMNSLKCPRCDSTNTKFCYYNNYSLSQPRYFCKSCRRYWTKGGTLRRVPVGGGCRRNKRSSSSSSSSPSSSSKRSQDQPIQSPMPPLSYDSNDLSLAIASLQKHNSGHCDDRDFSIWGHPRMAHHHHQSHGDVLGSFGANPSSSGMFDAIRSGFLENPAGGNGIGNVYHGVGNGNVEVENGVMGMSGAHEMGIEYEGYGASTTTAVMAVKQEMCGGARDGEGRISWCFPWPGVGGDGNGSDFDLARLNWNGLASSSWQGLLNSPLM